MLQIGTSSQRSNGLKPLWGSGGQSSRSHDAEGMAEASFLNPGSQKTGPLWLMWHNFTSSQHLLIVGWEHTCRLSAYCNDFGGLKNQSFRNNSDKLQVIWTKFGTHAQVTRRRCSRNFGRDPPSEGQNGSSDDSLRTGVFCCQKRDDFSATSQRPIFTKFGHKSWIEVYAHGFSNIFHLEVICPQKPPNWRDLTQTSLQPTGRTAERYWWLNHWRSVLTVSQRQLKPFSRTAAMVTYHNTLDHTHIGLPRRLSPAMATQNARVKCVYFGVEQQQHWMKLTSRRCFCLFTATSIYLLSIRRVNNW